MSDQTKSNASKQAADVNVEREHTVDSPTSEGERTQAEAQADSEKRKSVAEHEQEMMEIGAHVKGEGAIE